MASDSKAPKMKPKFAAGHAPCLGWQQRWCLNTCQGQEQLWSLGQDALGQPAAGESAGGTRALGFILTERDTLAAGTRNVPCRNVCKQLGEARCVRQAE